MAKKSGTTEELVGDPGFEPGTSTMSTWRSTPELIALLIFRALGVPPERIALHFQAPDRGRVRY